MKKFLWLLVLAFFFTGCDGTSGTRQNQIVQMNIPEATGYIVDSINLLPQDIKATIEQACKDFDTTNQIAQIAVLIVDSTQPYDIDQYGIKVAEKWKVGYAGKDNGVIIIVAKSDRKWRIEVGRGLEGSGLNDSVAGEIGRNVMVPEFKQGNYGAGILKGVLAIEERIKK